MPKQFDYGFSYRTFRATDHYNGTVLQTQRQDLQNFVINRQNIFDLLISSGLNSRANLALDIPITNSGWSIPRPIGNATTPPGRRVQQNGSGLGDITVVWRSWLKDPAAHGTSNVILGVGIKAPTGKANLTNILPDSNGENYQARVIDQSIQPGDGGWGIPTSIEAYKMVGRASVFFTGNYLINPRDTNGVPSGRTPTAAAPSINVFSVPDQYLYRFGVGAAITKVPGLAGAISWRKEGVPAKDLVGGQHGFRRPGYSTSIEPSLSYVNNGTTYNISVPFTITRNRVPTVSDGTPVAGDSTFARSQIVLNVSHRITLL